MTGESWDPQDREERTAPRDPRVAQDSQEMPGLLAPVGRRVNSVFLGCQVTPEDKDQRDLKVSRVSLVLTGRKELGERPESLDQEAREDQRDLVEREDRVDQQEKLDQRVTREATAPQDLPVRGVCQGLKDQPDSPDQRAHLAPLGKMDCPDILGREERLASKARRDPQAPPGWLDLRDRQVKQDQWETGATLDPQAHPASRDCPERRAKKEPRVIPDLLAQPERTVLPDPEVSPEREVCPVPWELTV